MKKLIGEANWNALKPVLIWIGFVIIPVAIFAFFDYPILNWVIDHVWIKWTIFWVLFSLFCGWAEALLIHTLINTKFYDIPKEIHIVFNIIRSFLWIPIIFLSGWLTAGCCVLLFPFFHDGNYYRVRNKQNSAAYKNKWWSNPHPTSKAITDVIMYTWVRTLLAVIGLVLLIYFNRSDLW
jgi:hypothetical protein